MPSSDIQVDHIIPVVDPNKGFETWDVFVERLYCDQDNLQAICKPCHDIKTKQEKKPKKWNISWYLMFN